MPQMTPLVLKVLLSLRAEECKWCCFLSNTLSYIERGFVPASDFATNKLVEYHIQIVYSLYNESIDLKCQLGHFYQWL